MAERTELWAVLSDTALDALGFAEKAAELADQRSLLCRVWYLAPALTKETAELLAASGAERITHLPVDPSDCNWERTARDTLAAASKESGPEAILFLSSVFFCAVAPGVAAMLGTGITADCTGLFWDSDGYLLQSRPTFGGRKLATIRTRSSPAIATVRRGVFSERQTGRSQRVPVDHPDIRQALPFCCLLKTDEETSPLDLRRAPILLAGGAGLGDREHFERLYELAALTGGETAASRGAVAAGFAPYGRQVGQTGVTVRPKLYVAFGISGAVQHLSGMIESGCIVAVNPDREAPIHQYSDYSIYADANQVIADLLQELKKGQTRRTG